MKLSPLQKELQDKWFGIIRDKFKISPNRYEDNASGLALTVVHWHHNIEYDKRNNETDKSSFFCREYSKIATEQWLWETIQRLDSDNNFPESPKRSFQDIDDHQTLANNLCVALESYEINDRRIEEKIY